MDEAKKLWKVRICDDLAVNDLQAVADFFNENYPGVFFPKLVLRICGHGSWGHQTQPAADSSTVAFADGGVVGTTSMVLDKGFA